MKHLLRTLEPLEARIAPATLVNPTTITYQDRDGDTVTVKLSKPLLTDVDTANTVLHFDAGTIVQDTGGNAAKQGLQLIDFTALLIDDATGLGVTVTAVRSTTTGGDGFADVGFLKATGRDIGAVSIGGDLGRIVAGLPETSMVAITDLVPAVKSLTVQSMGELGTTTQAAMGTLVSTLAGPLPSFIVKGNLRDASISLTGPAAYEKFGAVTIGGSVLGGTIKTTGDIGVIHVAGDVRGGSTANTGYIFADGKIGTATIGGSLIGTVLSTGTVKASGKITSITVGGSLRGGSGNFSGSILTAFDAVGSISVGGTLFGGGGNQSGAIEVGFSIGRVTIGGDLIGGGGESSGAIISDSDALKSVTIKGSVTGGAGSNSASITAEEAIGALTIGGSLRGGLGDSSASISAMSDSGAFVIGASVIGFQGGAGEGFGSAQITAQSFASLKVGGSIIGGSGDNSANIQATFEGFGPITIGGSLLGGAGADSGKILSSEAIGAVTIGGDLRGGAGSDSGQIDASGDRLASLTINGSVFSGTGPRSGLIDGYTGIPTLIIKGSLVGTAAVKATIQSNYNPTATGLSLGRISIGGRVEFAEILAGYLSPTNGFDADAKIGSVTVGGDWIASSMSAGVSRGTDNMFGTADDTRNSYNPAPDPSFPLPATAFVSRIGSVVIKGQALGTVGGTDAFGIVSENIGSIKVGVSTETLTTGVNAVPLGATGDFIAREDAATSKITLPTFADATGLHLDSAFQAHFTDVDGDLVTVKTTKQMLTAANFNLVAADHGYQLRSITIAGAASAGATLTITAKPQDFNADHVLDGDGFVNVGQVSAANLALGAVKITGDVGRIVAGPNDASANAVASLDVQSMGIFGISTQAAGGSLISTFRGGVPKLTIHGDVLHADLTISGQTGGQLPENGAIGTLTIGGSVRGGDSGAGLGRIAATGAIGPVTIGGDVIGGLITGDPMTVNADNSGRISAGGAMGAVKVGGSIIGGAGEKSGQIAAHSILSAAIGRDIRGGAEEDSGALDGGLKIGALTIGGSVVGGAGEESGSVLAESIGGTITSIKVGGDVRGGVGQESGYLHAQQMLGPVIIAGSFLGGDGPRSGLIYAGSSVAAPHFISSITINGDVIGGAGDTSAAIGSAFNAVGQSANINITTLTIKGSLIGKGDRSASITANDITTLTIGGNVLGGTGLSAGLHAVGDVGKITVGGSIVGASGGSAQFFAGTLDSFTLAHDLRGGGGDGSGEIYVAGKTNTISVGGSIESGLGLQAGSIHVNGPLGSLTIKGNVTGTAGHLALLEARGASGQITPLAIGRLSITGNVEFARVLGGYASSTTSQNSVAGLGAISVGGTWRAGDIVAGLDAGNDGFFGTNDDQRGAQNQVTGQHSKIASIVITGRAFGTVGGSDAFGFAAEEIGSVKIGAVAFTLKAGADNDNETLPPAEAARLFAGPTGDLRIRER